MLRQAGESILASQTEGIELDPNLSAVENAQAYFARYRKAREAEERVPPLLAEAQRAASYLGDLQALVEVAEDMAAIRALRHEVAEATGSMSRQRESKASSRSAPYRRVALTDGYEALVGTSAAGNAAVTFDIARADDLWLHARGVPGAHVILRDSPPDDVIERAAALAAHHSASRTANSVEVDVAKRRYVKKIPGGPPGLVRYSNERTLRVSPRGA
jgi:predicted ribosome quality control (RQC) complex YloA/Tae2 family protein